MLVLQLLLNGLVIGCLQGLVACSFALIYATTGVFHIAHAGVFLVGAYVLWSALEQFGLPLPVGLALGLIAASLVGMAIQWFVYRRLRMSNATPLVIMIASLGLLAILDNTIAGIFTTDTLFYSMSWTKEVVRLGSLIITVNQIVSLVLAIAIGCAIQALLSFTSLGRKIRAVAANPLMAEIGRLRPQRIYLAVYAIASATTSVAGILVSSDFGLRPYTGITYLLTASIAMIAAGIGQVSGAFVIAVIISVVQQLTLLFMPAQFGFALAFGFFVVLIVLMPRGIFGSRF